MDNMRTDFENLEDGDVIVAYPYSDNPLHEGAVQLSLYYGYFFDEENDEDPAYYMGDVYRFLAGFDYVTNEKEPK